MLSEQEYLDRVGEYLRLYTTGVWDRGVFRHAMAVALDRYTDPEYDTKFRERVENERGNRSV